MSAGIQSWNTGMKSRGDFNWNDLETVGEKVVGGRTKGEEGIWNFVTVKLMISAKQR